MTIETSLNSKVKKVISHIHELKNNGENIATKLETKAAEQTSEQLNKLASKLESQNQVIESLMAKMARPGTTNSQEISAQCMEHKNAFCDYVRKGHENNLSNLEKKAMSSIPDKDGGYLVTKTMMQFIEKTVNSSSTIRSIASTAQISGDSLEIIEDYNAPVVGWTGETEARANTQTPQLIKKTIAVHELYAQPKATQKLLDDSSIDIENWLAEKVTQSFLATENSSFINGDGDGKPRGILSYAKTKTEDGYEVIETGTSGEITYESIMILYFSLQEQFAVNAKFLVSRHALQAIRTIKDPATGKYLWQPSLDGQMPSTLLGVEVIQCADMPLAEAGNIPVAFGDFSAGYMVVDRQGVRILRDPFTDKPFVKFYATKRVGGAALNFNAIKLLKVSK